MSSADTGAQVVDKRRNWEARVEMMVFKRPSNELSTYDKLVYAILCGHANRDGNAMLYVRTIAEEASCSERQTQRSLSNLEACGLLIRRPQNHNGRQTFNIYEIYGFEAYIFDESSGKSVPELLSGRKSISDDPRVQDSHPRPVRQSPQG
jgi:predicted transcriptional regulator